MYGDTEVIFWDVQHGHASYISSPNNKHIVVDLGIGSHKGADKTFSPLMHLKKKYGVTALNYFVISHPHKDHIDDILNLDNVRPHIFARPRDLGREDILPLDVREEDKALYEKYLKIDSEYVAPITDTNPDNPRRSENYGGLQINTFWAEKCSKTNLNEKSVVTVLSYATTKIVIPGDNESASWKELLEDDTHKDLLKNADILLAPHHGRESGFHLDAINLINPRLTVVSDAEVCDSSANSRYSAKSRGWTVHRRGGEDITRKCVTTNSDGVVVVKFGYNTGERPFLSVTID